MFHVEHMKNTLFLLIYLILPLFLLSCKKEDPNPELSDIIYKDLKSEYDMSVKQEAELQAQVEENTSHYLKTPPQQGLSNVNRSKLTASENSLATVKQQKKYFEIKIEQRRLYVQQRYKESLAEGGRPWPDPKETEDYKIRLKLQRDKFEWDVRRSKDGNVPRGTTESKVSPNSEEKPKAEASSGH